MTFRIVFFFTVGIFTRLAVRKCDCTAEMLERRSSRMKTFHSRRGTGSKEITGGILNPEGFSYLYNSRWILLAPLEYNSKNVCVPNRGKRTEKSYSQRSFEFLRIVIVTIIITVFFFFFSSTRASVYVNVFGVCSTAHDARRYE